LPGIEATVVATYLKMSYKTIHEFLKTPRKMFEAFPGFVILPLIICPFPGLLLVFEKGEEIKNWASNGSGAIEKHQR
jgi:hypothetical protein